MNSDVENEEPAIVVENGKKRSGNDELQSLKSTKRPRTLETAETAEIDEELLSTERIPYQVRYRRVLRNIPQDIPYIPVTTDKGSRIYLRIIKNKKEDKEWDLDDIENQEEDEPKKLISTKGGSNRNLYHNWSEIKTAASKLKANFLKTLGGVADSENVAANLIKAENNGRRDPSKESLWVEKYKPKSYLDLLSEEGLNRMLLHWLKLWDKSVFGVDYLAKVKFIKEKYATLDAKEKEKFEKEKWKYSKVAPPPQIEEGYDEMGRPKFKVALLHGPPGLGKTTCAHIVGKHAGYNVREMNASDDRSIEIFRKTLDDALQSKSEAFDGKPNCLVIDEIDGAPAASVNVLVELITGNATEKGKGKKLKKVLKRPIICICNDLFAPSLKELKKHALILQFSPVTVQSLANRLNDISCQEQLYLDNATITSLCEKSECDIRSCLSTLQFMKSKNCTPKDAIFSQIGMKDKSKGIFAVWQDIFTIPDNKRKRYYDIEDQAKPEVRFNSVLRVVQNHGEYEKLLGGVFENYLNVKFKDCYFESILEGLSWTSWFQDINESIEQNQNYVLMGYLPLFFVSCHFLFGQRSWFKLSMPNSEMSFKIPRARGIISNILSDVSPQISRFLDPFVAVVDLFPALSTIIQPGTIRPVPTQIWSARERETMRNVVDLMITYGLSYTQVKNVDTGTYQFVLEPDIEKVAKFKLQESQGSKRTFPYAVKQLVAREIETEKMRRSDGPEEEPSSNSNNGNKPSELPKQEFKVPRPAKTIAPKVIHLNPIMVVASKDFFGRPMEPSAQTKQDMLALQRRSSGIYFKFKEGYSNAVRRFVKMKDLE